MIEILDKTRCCACTACASICPMKCITMKADEEGFLYPIVDTSLCVNCGICDSTCPLKQEDDKLQFSNQYKAYAIQCKDLSILKQSTSGGFFTPLAQYILSNNGVVYGVGFNENLEVIHKEATHQEQLLEFCGSKYVQSDLQDTFQKIYKHLNESKMVLFSGTPCQVEGLLAFLNKEYDNLITVDLICHGTPSPLLWKKYVEYQECKYSSKITKVNFRHKTYGYHSGAMQLIFEDGNVYSGSARVDYMLKAFFSEISSRPSCYICGFKKKYHNSDFTIYDCWSAERLNRAIKDKDMGYTNLIINTAKGFNIFKSISNQYEIFEVSLEQQIEFDGPMVCNSAVPHKRRKDFYKYLIQYGLSETVNKFIPISRKDYMIEKSKFILYKMKIMPILKLIKGRIRK